MNWCRIKSLVLGATLALCAFIPNPSALADGSNSGPGSGYGGQPDQIVCKIKAQGKGFIVVGESNCIHFEFEFEFEEDELEGRFNVCDTETGVCARGCRIIDSEKIDDHTLVIDLEVLFSVNEKGTLSIKIADGGKSGPDTFEITGADGSSASGEVNGHIKVEVECKVKCKGGAYCPGHPHCDEHPFCKGKKCKGHKDCADRDDDDDDDDGDGHDGDDDEGDGHDGDDDDGDDDGDHKCKGHPECKSKCKGKQFCKGHPFCDEHPVCEVPSCKGHKKCKDAKCKGHPECRKNYKHKKGCKAKTNPKNRCSCKAIKR